MNELANLNTKQLRAWKQEQDKARILDIVRAVASHPVFGLVGGFLAIDYLEYKTWGDSQNTMLGPVSANALRAVIVLPPFLEVLGKVADVAGSVMALKAMGKGG